MEHFWHFVGSFTGSFVGTLIGTAVYSWIQARRMKRIFKKMETGAFEMLTEAMNRQPRRDPTLPIA